MGGDGCEWVGTCRWVVYVHPTTQTHTQHTRTTRMHLVSIVQRIECIVEKFHLRLGSIGFDWVRLDSIGFDYSNQIRSDQINSKQNSEYDVFTFVALQFG